MSESSTATSDGMSITTHTGSPVSRAERESTVSNLEPSFTAGSTTDSKGRHISTATDVLIGYGHFFTFRARSIGDFKCYLYLALLMNVFYVATEFLGCYSIAVTPRTIFINAELALIVLALLFSIVDTVLIVQLINRRSKNLCVGAFFLMLTTDVLYSIQLALVTAHDGSETLDFGVFFLICVVALVFQIFPLLVTYRFVHLFVAAHQQLIIVLLWFHRYWEYLMYNYDPSEEGRIYKDRKSDSVYSHQHGRYDSRESSSTTFTVDIVLNAINNSNATIVAERDMKLSQEFKF
jgi:hypothetical protein